MLTRKALTGRFEQHPPRFEALLLEVLLVFLVSSASPASSSPRLRFVPRLVLFLGCLPLFAESPLFFLAAADRGLADRVLTDRNGASSSDLCVERWNEV